MNGEEINLTRGESGFERPAYYVPGMELDLFPSPMVIIQDPELLIDSVLNLLCFIPIGLTVVLLSRSRRPVLRATLFCIVISLAAEIAQVFIVNRYPSAVDFLLNTSGGLVGACLATNFIQMRSNDTQSADLSRVVA